MITNTPSVRNWRLRYAVGAFLDRSADLLHLRGALAGGEHLPAQNEADGQGSEGDHRDHTDEDAIIRPELDAQGEGGHGHPSSWFSQYRARELRRRPWRLDKTRSPQVGAVHRPTQCRRAAHTAR